MTCKIDHSSLASKMIGLPTGQGGVGRHKCAACAYRAGYDAGYSLDESLSINQVLERLDESQAGAQRHKSPHAAFALGYYDGVCRRIEEDNR